MVSQLIPYFINWYGKPYNYREIELRRAYRVHNADFLRNCPENRRIILEDINCGWEVICGFVNKPIPKVDFPHMNKKAGIVKQLQTKSRLQEESEAHMRKLTVKFVTISVLSGFLYYKRNEIQEIIFK